MRAQRSAERVLRTTRRAHRERHRHRDYTIRDRERPRQPDRLPHQRPRPARGLPRDAGERLDLLAVYHSHPTSEPVPSRRDVDENTYGESSFT